MTQVDLLSRPETGLRLLVHLHTQGTGSEHNPHRFSLRKFVLLLLELGGEAVVGQWNLELGGSVDDLSEAIPLPAGLLTRLAKMLYDGWRRPSNRSRRTNVSGNRCHGRFVVQQLVLWDALDFKGASGWGTRPD